MEKEEEDSYREVLVEIRVKTMHLVGLEVAVGLMEMEVEQVVGEGIQEVQVVITTISLLVEVEDRLIVDQTRPIHVAITSKVMATSSLLLYKTAMFPVLQSNLILISNNLDIIH